MIAIILDLVVIVSLAMMFVYPLMKLRNNQDVARKAVGWLWIILGIVPLLATVIDVIFGADDILSEAIVFAAFAVPVVVPAMCLVRKEGKSVSIILAYSWIFMSITGLFFLLFMMGTPMVVLNFLRGQAAAPDYLPSIVAGFIWTSAVLVIFCSTIRVLGKIKETRILTSRSTGGCAVPSRVPRRYRQKMKIDKKAMEKIHEATRSQLEMVGVDKEYSMGMKVILGMASVFPIGYMFFFMVAVVSMVIFPKPLAGHFLVLVLLHIGTIFISFALMAFYITYIFRTKKVDADKKVLWAVVIFLGSFVAMPVFWYLYIWRHRNPLMPERGAEDGAVTCGF